MSEGLTAELRTLAESIGVDAFGVAAAHPFRRELLTLQRHKAEGRSGPLRFTYSAPEVATDIKMSFPWAERFVAVGWNYLRDAVAPATAGPVIGRFATSDQYESVRLVAGSLAEHLRQRGFRAEIVIDDNRLVDRAAAIRAGLGWSGKNTMLLTPGHGPWMLLGSVVTDAPLATTEPMQRSCGTCVACIPACPTNAIDEHGLDARRCLSTWLQTAGSIPQWIRPRLGRRIYGCDECLTACPPGKRTLAAAEREPLVNSFSVLLGLNDEQLLEAFAWWYVPRRQGRFIRRNLLVAAGNAGEAEDRAIVEAHMAHPSSMIRGHAYWALARGWGTEARAMLRESLTIDTVPESKDELALALLMVERPEDHRSMLVVDEWAHTDEALRGLALIQGRDEPADLDFLVLHDGGEPSPMPHAGANLVYVEGEPRDIDRPLVSVYDPDRKLKKWRATPSERA